MTLGELHSVIGLLNFACCVVLPGRAFLRRLIHLTKGVVKPHHRIRLNNQARLDLRVWDDFFFLNLMARAYFWTTSGKILRNLFFTQMHRAA